MSDLQLIGTSSTELLKHNDVLRLTFSKSYSWLNDDFFSGKTKEIWSQIDLTGKLYTISPNPAIIDGKPAVIDVRISKDSRVNEISNSLSTIAGYYVTLSKLEKLKPEQAKVAASNVGAEQRETAKDQQAKADADNSLTGQIGKALNLAKKTVIIGLVIVVVVAVIVYAPQLKAVARRVKR
jgi:hypothetical protein